MRRLRERLGLTQAGLAKAIGMQKNSVARMERDERPIVKTTTYIDDIWMKAKGE